ncbi:hypothetical protein ACIPJK_07495 [Streptomyces roseus]|uniref:hypothetical protein n=1 Tax=Streptomyces roseus TaxID=66430 RepID=UPI00380DA201
MTEPVAPIDWARHYAAQREQQPEPVCKFEQGCHLVAPCNPGCGAPRPTAEQPARYTVDTITSDSRRTSMRNLLDRADRGVLAASEAALLRQQIHEELSIAAQARVNLDEVRAERDANERRAEAYGQAWKAAEQRAKQAEATIARVRALADRLDLLACAALGTPVSSVDKATAATANLIRAALDEPKETRP